MLLMPLKSRLSRVEDFSTIQTPRAAAKKINPLKKLDFKKFSPKSYTPILVVLLIIGSFFLGMLVDKVQYLQNGGATTPPIGGTNAGQQAGAGNQQPPPAKKFDNSTGAFPVLGNKNAKVTIVEFADFQCPFCEKFFTDSYPSLKKDYIDTGKVKFAFRDYAFLGQESTFAAEAGRCANDQGKFWDYHDYLYSHQGSENSGTFAKDKLEGFAATMGLDTQQFNQCLESDKYAKDVAADTKAGQDFGVSGTPGTFINGTLIVGAQPYASFQTAIDQALAGK